MFYVYLLQSDVDSTFYVGYTENLEQRLEQHNNGESKYTSRKAPWKLVYFEHFETKSEALKRELFLKKQRNKEFYQRLVNTMDR
jgi:putative endonuclease